MRLLRAAQRTRVIRCAVVLLGIAIAAGAAPALSRGDPARGETKSANCGSCHGSPQTPALAGTPYLAGQQEEYLVLQMVLLREGLRDVPQMTALLKGLTDPDLEDIAAYFSRQSPPASKAKPDPQLHARGAQLAKTMGCGSCHLQDYRGQKQVPRISNLREDYLVATLKAYRDNKRTGPDTNMNGMLYRVPDSDIQALAHYFANVSDK
jgi:cytochrome c553